MIGDRAEPSLPVPAGPPLGRAARRRRSGRSPPRASPRRPRPSRIFLVAGDRRSGRSTRPRARRPGRPTWAAQPVWVGYLADKVIAATDDPARRARPGQGRGRTGGTTSAPPATAGAAPNPFAQARGRAGGRRAGRRRALHDFRIVGGRVFCLRGDRELLALDGDTGLVDWSFAPLGGAINPHLWIGPQRIVLQVRKPNADPRARDRRPAAAAPSIPQAEDEDWARDPAADRRRPRRAGRRPPDGRPVRPRAAGSTPGSSARAPSCPRNGPPRLLGDAERLLVLHDGNELIRLDPATGRRSAGRGPLGIEDLSERPEATRARRRSVLLGERPDASTPRRWPTASLGLDAAPDRARVGLVARPDRALRRWPTPARRGAGRERARGPAPGLPPPRRRASWSSGCSSRSPSPTSPSGSRPAAPWSPPRAGSGRWATGPDDGRAPAPAVRLWT